MFVVPQFRTLGMRCKPLAIKLQPDYAKQGYDFTPFEDSWPQRRAVASTESLQGIVIANRRGQTVSIRWVPLLAYVLPAPFHRTFLVRPVLRIAINGFSVIVFDSASLQGNSWGLLRVVTYDSLIPRSRG